MVSDMTIERILENEVKLHRIFFGEKFDLTEFEATLQKYGEDKVRRWNALGLEPHFLPEITMSRETEFPGWKVKPDEWLYLKVKEGKILRQRFDGELQVDHNAFALEGVTVLVDTRLKPTHKEDKQMWADDHLFLGPIMERLRDEKRITENYYGLQSSRFDVSIDEWAHEIRPAVADFLGLGCSQIRLERAIEMNVIPQLYPHMPRKDDLATDRGFSWIWLEEYFAVRANRLVGGQFYYGGFAFVFWPDALRSYGCFRPLALI